MTTQEKGAASACWTEHVLNVTLMTAQRQHAENDIIMTLPAQWRPSIQIDVVAYHNGKTCVLRIGTNGQVKIWLLPETANSRIYANFVVIPYR